MGTRMHHQFQVLGRMRPNGKNHIPPLFRMKIWAKDSLRAQSKFWFFLRKIQRIKKTKGHTVYCQAIFEKKPTVSKLFGIWITFESRTGNHNAFKEYSDMSLNGAVNQLHMEMASRHKIQTESVQILKTAAIAPERCKRS